MDIKNTDDRIIFSAKADTIRELVEVAVKKGANLRYADLRSANLYSADLRYANLQYADLRSADLRYANLQYADLRYADLCSADLCYANLQDANLYSADLRYADLRSANLRSADLRSADLCSANLDFSAWPLWCGSLDVKIDIRIARQLAYHALAAMSKSQRAKFIADPIGFANKFHRVGEVAKIK